jgi:serine protease
MARMSRLLSAVCLGAAASAAIATAAVLHERAPVRKAPTSYSDSTTAARVIVKFRDQASTLSAKTTSARSGPQAASMLGARVGLTLTDGRVLGTRTQVMKATGLTSSALATIVAQDSEVEWAEVDHRRFVQTAPSDPLYASATSPAVGQWYLRAPTSTTLSAINIEPAWAITTNASSATAASTSAIVIADVDTGITSHPDLSSKLFTATFTGTTSSTPYGYDFVGYGSSSTAATLTANDGGGADPDPSDPGDWITTAEDAGTVDNGDFKSCGVSDSSWHGTETAGILGAATNNATGMASVGYGTMIVPVRALGKCGGYDSDIIAAMEWAGGVLVDSSIPTNIHPARVINASLGGTGSCGSAYQEALTLLRNNKVLVVAAAGNDEGLTVDAPANCQPAISDTDQTPIVIAVAGLRQMGDKVGYSDIGPQVTIAAPAGNCVNTAGECLYPILTTSNTGTTVPITTTAGPTYTTGGADASLGTSFSTPMVAGTVALMLATAPNLTNAQVVSILKSSATAFPTSGGSTGTVACTAPTSTVQDECYCTTTTCGAGMLNAGAAVTAAAATVAPVPSITASASTVVVGSSVTLSGAGSTSANSTISSYTWAIASGSSDATLGSTTGSSVTLTGVAAGSVTVQLTVLDATGASASTTSTVTVTAAATSSGSSGSTSSGGGGAASPVWLLLLLLAGALLGPRRRRAN